jgi:methionyl-tRNA synthetase
MLHISWEDFEKIDMRVGEIVEASEVEGSEKLIKMSVDFGELGIKTVFSGIKKYYQPEQLKGKKTVFVVNVTPKKVMGQESEAMIVGADDDEGTMSLLLMEKEMKNGARVY